MPSIWTSIKLIHSPTRHFETVPNSKKLQTITKILQDFEIENIVEIGEIGHFVPDSKKLQTITKMWL